MEGTYSDCDQANLRWRWLFQVEAVDKSKYYLFFTSEFGSIYIKNGSKPNYQGCNTEIRMFNDILHKKSDDWVIVHSECKNNQYFIYVLK